MPLDPAPSLLVWASSLRVAPGEQEPGVGLPTRLGPTVGRRQEGGHLGEGLTVGRRQEAGDRRAGTWEGISLLLGRGWLPRSAGRP